MRFDEKIKDTCEGMKKRVASRYNIPTVLSYQFNREATKLSKKEQTGLEHISGSDAIGQICSIVLGLFQGDEKSDQLNKKDVMVIKGREGEQGQFPINWQFNNFPAMNFTEITSKEIEEDAKKDLDHL